MCIRDRIDSNGITKGVNKHGLIALGLAEYTDFVGKTIRELYNKFLILDVEWSYGMNKTKESSEIVIISK